MRVSPGNKPLENIQAVRDMILDQAIHGTSIDAGPGDDMVYGTKGSDLICGGQGNDIIMAGAGNDFIDGCPGDDQLIGGAGRDVFQFYNFNKGSHDTIMDWQDGKDIVELYGITADNVHLSGHGKVHILTVDGGTDSVTILGKGFDLGDILFT